MRSYLHSSRFSGVSNRLLPKSSKLKILPGCRRTPALGDYGRFTVAIAMVATAGALLSIFAVSRMFMLTEMKLVPHRHLGMPEAFKNIRWSILWCWV